MDQMYCKVCGNVMHVSAVACPSCGAVVGSNTSGVDSGKSKIVAGILAIFLGGFGVHKFYLGRVLMGLLYLFFSWTFIPALIGLIEGIIYLCMDEGKFHERARLGLL